MRRYAIAVAATLLVFVWVSLVTARSEYVTPIPYIYRIDIKGCEGELPNRRQTGFRVKELRGIVTALHGVVDCQKTISAVADGGQEIFTDLKLQQVDIDRDIVLLTSPTLEALPADGLQPKVVPNVKTKNQ